MSRQSEPLTIEALVDIQWNSDHKDYVVLVKWDRLEEIESSWEPMTKLFKEAPKLSEQFCEDKSSEVKKHLAELLKTSEKPAVANSRKREWPDELAAPKSGAMHSQSNRRVRNRAT